MVDGGRIEIRIGTGNPENHHDFHARILAEMNTIKKKQRAVSDWQQGVVECGQRKNELSGRGWAYADRGNRS